MRRLFSRSLLIAAFFMLHTVSCSDRMPVPYKAMQAIYYDMLLADSYVSMAPESRTASDSIAIYPSIIEKHGYSVEQFLASQAILLKDPEKMSRIFEANKKAFLDSAESFMSRIQIRDSIADAEFQLEEASRMALEKFLDSISFARLLDTLLLTFSGDSLVIDTLFTVTDSLRVRALPDSGDVALQEPASRVEEEPGEDSEEVERELKKLDEIPSVVRTEESRPSEKRLLRRKEKRNNMPDKKQLKEIEEKFK